MNMKKIWAVLLAALMLTSAVACGSGKNTGEITTADEASTTTPDQASEEPAFNGTVNTAEWKVEEGVDYSKYQFLGRGEELVKEIAEKYSRYSVTYKLNGRSTTAASLNSLVNLMATYEEDATNKKLTVNIDTIDVRVQCDYTDISSETGKFIVIGFTTNLPTKFIASIGAKGSTKGEICQEGITPEGKDGTYTAKVKLTVPYVNAGSYYLNFSIDSGNAGYPLLLSIPFEIAEGENFDSEYKLLYAGDWDLITAKGYQDSLTKLFYNSYPKLYARWGTGSEPKTVTFVADKGYDGVAYSSGRQVVVSVDYANANPRDIGFFSHEITHQVQQYWFSSSWWTENMANYGGFRYFHWSDAEYVQLYKDANQSDLYDWNWQPYGDGSKWFLAYLDEHWPTGKNADGSLNLGLIDTINKEIKSGRLTGQSDDPKDPNNTFNKIVKEITGFDCMEDIRVQYAAEFKSGAWDFKGFGNYTDNFLTENLPNVENSVYPMVTDPLHGNKSATAENAVVNDSNLCLNASIYGRSGVASVRMSAEKMIDGNTDTKWSVETCELNAYTLDGALQWIIVDLGEVKTFSKYTMISGASTPLAEWGIFISEDAKHWTSVDYQNGNEQASASYAIGETSARYVLIRIYNSGDTNKSAVKIAEFGLYE